MSNVIQIVTTECSEWGEYEAVEIRLNGEVIAEGSFGGEPEDNSRHRDYSWVDDAIEAVAERLGATVEYVDETGGDES